MDFLIAAAHRMRPSNTCLPAGSVVISLSTSATSKSVPSQLRSESCPSLGLSSPNPQGCPSKSSVVEGHNNVQQIEHSLSSTLCYVSSCQWTVAMSDEVDRLSLVVATMRHLRELDNSMCNTRAEALLAKFESLTTTTTVLPCPVRDFIKNLNTTVAGKNLCQTCFAATFDMLKPSGQFKTTWITARTSYCANEPFQKQVPILTLTPILISDLCTWHSSVKQVRLTRRGRFKSSVTSNDLTSQALLEPFTDTQIQILMWLSEFAKRGYGEQSPVDGAFHMQYCTKQQCFKVYNDRCRDFGQEQVTERYFRQTLQKMNNKRTPWVPPGSDKPMRVRFHKYSAFGKCTVCIGIVLEVKATLNKATRAYLLNLLQCHRHTAYQEKQAWYMVRELAMANEMIWSLGQDNLDKRKTRMILLGRELKGHGIDDVYFVNATLGVVPVAGVGNYVFIAAPHLPDNANLALEMVHLTLMDVTARYASRHADNGKYQGPAEFDLQVDGCSVNKNLTKMGYMAWLCATRQMTLCSDNYMIVGHTHDLMDSILAIISRWIKTGLLIRTIQDLVQAVHDAFVKLSARPVRIIVLNSVHHWTLLFENKIKLGRFKCHVPDSERPHRFEVCRATSGAVELWYKNLRQQSFYWNEVPLPLLEEAVPDLADLQIELPSNSQCLRNHLKSLAACRHKFLRIFEISAIQPLVANCENDWTKWWSMFAETGLFGGTKKISRLNTDLSSLEEFMTAEV